MFKIDNEMIMLENSGQREDEYLYGITRNSLENYENYLEKTDITFDKKGAYIKGMNIKKVNVDKLSRYPYRYYKELKLYKAGSSFKILSFYYLSYWSDTSSGTSYYLVQSNNDGSTMWVYASDVDSTHSCSIRYNGKRYAFEQSILDNYQNETVKDSFLSVDEYAKSDSLYNVSIAYQKEYDEQTLRKRAKKIALLKKELYTEIINRKYVQIKNYIKSGFEINSRFYNGQTALILAVINKNAIAVTSLLNGGADVNIVYDFGKTAFDYVDKNSSTYASLRIRDSKNKTKN